MSYTFFELLYVKHFMISCTTLASRDYICTLRKFAAFLENIFNIGDVVTSLWWIFELYYTLAIKINYINLMSERNSLKVILIIKFSQSENVGSNNLKKVPAIPVQFLLQNLFYRSYMKT
jgi:hypothetical protein